jgi:ABC-2 type transport system permease protein
LQSLRQEHKLTILLTTHRLEEAEQACERVAIMHHGRIQACGSLADLRRELHLGDRYLIQVQHLEGSTRENLSHYLAQPADDSSDSAPATLQVSDAEALTNALDILRQRGVKVTAVEHQPARLDEIFSRLVQRENQSQSPFSGTVAISSQAGVSAAEEAQQRAPTPEPQSGAQPGADQGLQESLTGWRQIAGAFLLRDLRQEISYRVAFFLQLFNIFFTVAIYYFIARLIGPAVAPQLARYGTDYFTFVLTGIAFTQYFSVGLNSFTTSLRQAQTTGTLEAMLSTPISLTALILCSALWEFCLSTLRVVVYLAVGVLFLGVNLAGGNWPLAGLTLLLTVTTFSSLGILAASFIMVLKRGDPITWMFNAVSHLLGGVYYPISVLPAWLQHLALLLPVTYALEAMRLALKPGTPFSQIQPSLVGLVVFGCLLLPVSLLAFRFAVRQARIDGSLTHF